MKKSFFYLLFIVLNILSFSKEKDNLVIGVIYDNFIQSKNISYSLMEKEINNLVGDKYNVIFPEDKQIEIIGTDKNEISKKINVLLDDPSVDIIIAGGVLVSYAVLERDNLTKPIFAPLIINLPKEIAIGKNMVSGKKNLNYIVSNLDLKSEIINFSKIKNFKKLSVLIGKEMENILNQMPGFSVDGINVEFIKMNNENMPELLEKIKNSEVVALGPIKELSEKNQHILLNSINENKIPSFSIFSLEDGNFQTLAQYSFEKEYNKRIRTMAVNISQYLDGKKLSDLPIYIEANQPELILNMESIKKTGIWPDWTILAEAKLINFIPNSSPNSMNLKELIQIALNNSPKINILKKELDLASLNIDKVKSNYKPKIDANATAMIIDEDRAASILTPVEKTLNAGVTLTQVILNEDLNMNKDILIKQREIKKAEIKKAELDLVLETAEAYMAVLKVESSAKIQKNNLELTKRNLELAKERKEAGISGQADIYRFESELSKSISSLVETMLNIDIAKTNLKRIINYNLQQPLELVNIDFNSGDFLTSNSEFFKYISNQNNTNLLIDFMHEMAMKSSTDLKKIDYGVEIQKRLIKNTKNKKFIPTIALQANYSINNIIAEGAGSSYPDFGTIIGDVSHSNTQKALGSIVGAFGNPDEFNWSVALGFSLPIYTGGELKIDKKIAENSIEVLELQKDTTQKNIDQQIITSISKVVTEYSKIKNAEISLTSALKALNIVKESYSSGITSIFDLISSQNAAFSAEEYKSTITYDLMTAIMRTERVLEEFYILKSDEEKAEISKKIDLINK